MSLIYDLENIERTVLPTDPSFRAVDADALERRISDARQAARAGTKDAFLLALMRLLALPGNGHTRLIPNGAISVLPLRFVSIGSVVRLLGAPSGGAGSVGGVLDAVNGVQVDEIEAAAATFLAGTEQRKRVIGPLLFAWPEALVRLGVGSGSGAVTYRIRDQTGQISSLVLEGDDRVPGSALYPRNEHGKTDALWTPERFLSVRDFGERGMLLVLPSFFDAGKADLSQAISEAAERVSARPEAPLLIDVRGNTGGDFLRTMPLIDAISAGGTDRFTCVFVDNFTFSAAIVFVAILKHRLGSRCRLIGEEMGDGLTFYAEGGTQDLTTCGTVVRYSTAFHDWAERRIDATTPRVIAQKIVPAGTLKLDRRWVAVSDGIGPPDKVCEAVLDRLRV